MSGKTPPGSHGVYLAYTIQQQLKLVSFQVLVHVLCRVGSYAKKTKPVAEKRCVPPSLVTGTLPVPIVAAE